MNAAKRILACICVMAAVCFSIPTMVGAEGGAIRKADRANSWDFSLDVTYADETTIDGQGGYQ